MANGATIQRISSDLCANSLVIMLLLQAFMTWLTYLRYLSALYYSFEGLAILEFKDQVFSCDGTLDASYLNLVFTALPNLTAFQRSAITSQAEGSREG